MENVKNERNVRVVSAALRLTSSVMEDLDKVKGEVSLERVGDVLDANKGAVPEDIYEDTLTLANQFLSEAAKWKAREGNISKDRLDGVAMTYALMLDQDRARALRMAFITIEHKAPGFIELLLSEGLLGDYEELTREVYAKEHELGWCPDPNCSYEKDQ